MTDPPAVAILRWRKLSQSDSKLHGASGAAFWTGLPLGQRPCLFVLPFWHSRTRPLHGGIATENRPHTWRRQCLARSAPS